MKNRFVYFGSQIGYDFLSLMGVVFGRRPDPYINVLFQTCLIIEVHPDVKGRSFVDGLIIQVGNRYIKYIG